MKTQTEPAKTGKKHRHLLIFAVTAAVVFVVVLGTYTYYYTRILYGVFEQAIVIDGLGRGSGIPVNTYYTVPELASPSAKNNLLTTGANTDTLYSGGWLELGKGPLVLHVLDMNGRYYSVQFTNPWTGTDFAYVGRRTTGTKAGDYLITGPGWSGAVPAGMTQISSPNNEVLVLGRVLVENSSDLKTAYDLSKQITLTPLSQFQ